MKLINGNFTYAHPYNALKASRVYAESFPNRAHPYPQLFTHLHLYLRTKNRLTPGGYEEWQHEVADLAEEGILERVENDPMMSCRLLEKATGVLKSAVNRILRFNFLHPYHYTSVQNLHPGDAELYRQFCRHLLALTNHHKNFLFNILRTDENLFTRTKSSTSIIYIIMLTKIPT